MNKKYIIGNWKMNPLKIEEGLDLAKNIDTGLETPSDLFVGVTPPFLFIPKINEAVSNISVGAQDVFWESGTGAFTGELSPEQLKKVGSDFIIVGHSERRIYLDESDEILSKKVKNVLDSGLRVILCVGEPKDVKDKGIEESFSYIKDQIKKDLRLLNKDKNKVNENQVIVAYEPLWAISTFADSKPAEPGEVNKTISFIKSFISDEFSFSPSVLYGGSTDSENVNSFIKKESVDGVLVGGSSLDSAEFLKMVEIINKN